MIFPKGKFEKWHYVLCQIYKVLAFFYAASLNLTSSRGAVKRADKARQASQVALSTACLRPAT